MSKNKDNSLTLRNLARLRARATVYGGFWAAELRRLYPLIIQANAARFPAAVVSDMLKSTPAAGHPRA
jgi:hypothetical protein